MSHANSIVANYYGLDYGLIIHRHFHHVFHANCPVHWVADALAVGNVIFTVNIVTKTVWVYGRVGWWG